MKRAQSGASSRQCNTFGTTEVRAQASTPRGNRTEACVTAAFVNVPSKYTCKMGEIAAAVPDRARACTKQCKDLVEMVKAKKAAQKQVLNAIRAKK